MGIVALMVGVVVLAWWLTAPHIVTAARCDPAPTSATRRLIVLVPAFNQTTALWTAMRRRLATEIPEFANARWLCIDHYQKPWSRGRLDDIAHSVRDRIDEEWAKAKDYDEIVLIGHSVGGVLVRQAYLLAAG